MNDTDECKGSDEPDVTETKTVGAEHARVSKTDGEQRDETSQRDK